MIRYALLSGQPKFKQIVYIKATNSYEEAKAFFLQRKQLDERKFDEIFKIKPLSEIVNVSDEEGFRSPSEQQMFK